MYPVIFKKVVKTYHLDSVRVTALTNIDLEVRSNCFTVITGPSGSGKTTLLNLIGCIDQPDSGEIIIAGHNVHAMSDNEISDFRAFHLGYIFQNFNLLPVLTAYENVAYPLMLTKTPIAKQKKRVMELLDMVGLSDRAHNRPGQLSGGQRQRVAIARALATEPKLVLADEPTANLDSQTGDTIIKLMRKLQQEHQVSFVFSSHDPNVHAAADDTIYIRDGRIINVERHTT